MRHITNLMIERAVVVDNCVVITIRMSNGQWVQFKSEDLGDNDTAKSIARTIREEA